MKSAAILDVNSVNHQPGRKVWLVNSVNHRPAGKVQPVEMEVAILTKKLCYRGRFQPNRCSMAARPKLKLRATLTIFAAGERFLMPILLKVNYLKGNMEFLELDRAECLYLNDD